MKVGKLAAMAAAWVCVAAQAQVPQYGSNITLEQAKKVAAAAEAEARKNNWPVCIAVVDNAGHLVSYQRIDNTQTASVMICQDKAVSAAIFRRPTKAFGDRVAAGGGGVSVLNLRGAATSEGGLPLYAFSNTNAAHHAVWSRKFEAALGNFRRVFVSSQMGLRKPERASFDYISREIGVPNARILFFDDTPVNVEGARAAGLQAVHVRGPDDVQNAVRPWL